MNIQKIYEHLGANYRDVLSRFKTDERIEKYLNKLIEISEFEDLRTSLAENDYAEAFRHVHSLKGMSINMGITSLERVTSEMCELLRNGEAADILNEAFVKVEKEFVNIRDIVLGSRNKILIIEDAEFNREILEEILEDEYTVLLAEDGNAGLELLEKYSKEIRATLLDLIMPSLDGYEVLRIMGEKGYLNEMPVLVISSEQAVDVKKRCFDYGVSDFISKPFDDIIVKKRVKDTVDLFMFRKKYGDTFDLSSKNKDIVIDSASSHQAYKSMEEKNKKLTELLNTILEGRTPESPEHIDNVKRYTVIMAEQMMKDYPEYGLTKEKIQILEDASAMHDIGKISIPDTILNKPGRLTMQEFECIRQHTVKGCEILDEISAFWEDEFRQAAYDICKCHHERYDGNGYPEGLKGEEIPLSAQIVAIAEVYDALVHSQSYRQAMSKDEAVDMILRGECGAFSPQIIDTFKKIFPKNP